MISLAQKKLILSLSRKKKRDELSLFVAEGEKVVSDLLRGGMVAKYIFSVPEKISIVENICPSANIVSVDEVELSKVSSLSTRSHIIAIFQRPADADVLASPPADIALFLDDVQDPGNLGTIIRTADWFGVHNIICSSTCADAYGPKTVQATMGALCRAKISYTSAEDYLSFAKNNWHIPIVGTLMDGNDLYSLDIPIPAIVIMGNEGHGISQQLQKFISHRVLIPNYPAGVVTSESLNVSAATAVLLSELRRRMS